MAMIRRLPSCGMMGECRWRHVASSGRGSSMGLVMVMASMLIGTMMQSKGVHCWWPGPHLVIADIAYNKLHQAAKQHVDLYINAFKGFYEKENDFVMASAWADFLPSVGVFAFADWHFIDQSILASDLPNTTTAPEPAKENIVWALDHCYKTLQFSGSGDIWGRALMLRFLIHLVGDIHQPLHCVNRYSKSNFQKGGDHRGQDITLKNSHIPSVNDLHTFWDAGGGFMDNKETPQTASSADGLSTINLQHIHDVANQIMEVHPESQFPPTTKNFVQWATESRDNAMKYVYKGNLGTEKDIEADDYINDVKSESKKLVARAGYRLAFLLNQLFATPPDTTKYIAPERVEVLKEVFLNNCSTGGGSHADSNSSGDFNDGRFATYLAGGLGFAVVVGVAAVAVFRPDGKPKKKYKTLEMAARETRYSLRNPRPAYEEDEQEDDDSA